MVSKKKETFLSLIESLNNGPEKYVFTYERDISNYIRANTKIIQIGNLNDHNCIWWIKLQTMLELKYLQVLKQDRRPMENHYHRKINIVWEETVYGITG